jgi:hypothetical protein
MKIYFGIGIATMIISLIGCSVQTTPEVLNQRDLLERDLKIELERKSFTNKIPFAYETAHFSENSPTYFFRTEIYPNGTIQYKGETLTSLLFGAESFNIQKIPNYPIGTLFYVNELNARKDRVELALASTVDRSKKAILQIVLGESYETKYELESITILISNALSIDSQRFVRLASLQDEYRLLKTRLDASAKSSERIQYAKQLSEILEKIIAEKVPSSRRLLSYQKEKIDLDALIETLRPQAQQERLIEIQDILKKDDEELKLIKQRLQAKSADNLKMSERLSLLARWEEILKKKQQLHKEMQSWGVSLSPAETNSLVEASRELGLAQKEAAKYKNIAKMQQLENEYQQMKQRRLKLYDAYTKVFGTSQEKDAKEYLLDYLKRMYENRRAAEQLGLKQAGTEAAKLLDEIRRIQGK